MPEIPETWNGLPLYGNDIDDTTSPLEAGLGWITKLKKCDFPSKAIFEQQKKRRPYEKSGRLYHGWEKSAPPDYEVCDAAGLNIGVLDLPQAHNHQSLDQPIGMAYVGWIGVKPGTKFTSKWEVSCWKQR